MIVEYLSESLFMTEHEITSFAMTSPHRYKVYEIAKRNSKGTRTIGHPSKELKFIQRCIQKQLSEILPVHETAFAYKNGIGIKHNAEKHSNSKYLLKMDFENFFPSITPLLFFNAAKKHGIIFNKMDRLTLTGLLFRKPEGTNNLILSIGAPTSPLISNFIMYSFDEHINQICLDKKIVYTRYADDITFSTRIKNSLFELPEIISRLLKEHTKSIKINSQKTIFTSKAHNRHVTGVTLTNNGGLSIGRERKRIISSMIHKSKFNPITSEEASNLLGLISHATHIEPEFFDRMINKYGKDVINNIKLRILNG